MPCTVYHTITLSHYHTITLSHYHTIALSHYHTITLSHYHTITPLGRCCMINIFTNCSWNSWNSWNSVGAKKVGVRNISPRAFRRRVVRYWHPRGCRVIELGKTPEGDVIYIIYRRIRASVCVSHKSLLYAARRTRTLFYPSIIARTASCLVWPLLWSSSSIDTFAQLADRS